VKTIGLIGGMSWESSIEYYRIINEAVKERLGGLHSAKCIMHSVDFAEVEPLQHEGRWDEAAEHMVRAAKSVEAAGADFLVLCTNTMHKTADKMEEQISIPFLHIADATARKVIADGLKTVGLLGTRFTMEDDFYKGRLIDRHSLEVIVPHEDERQIVHQVIYDELCLGRIEAASKQKYVGIMNNLVSQGAEAIILGCTEIGMLVGPDDCDVPVFDTTRIHAEAAVDLALVDE
jgi:aspartate racemase